MKKDDLHKFKHLLNEITAESDRAAAVLSVAGMDDRLRVLLEKILTPEAPQSVSLLRPEDPLGSFSAKIELLYRIGLIGPDFHREFHLVRKIRNKFAHLSDEVSFNKSPVMDIANELSTPKLVAQFLQCASATEIRPRRKFNFVATFLLIFLEYLVDTTARLKEGKSEMAHSVQVVLKWISN